MNLQILFYVDVKANLDWNGVLESIKWTHDFYVSCMYFAAVKCLSGNFDITTYLIYECKVGRSCLCYLPGVIYNAIMYKPVKTTDNSIPK